MANKELKSRALSERPKRVPNPRGRVKGSQNKATIEFKTALNQLLESSTPEMIGWLERVAKDDPAKALDLIGKLAEYVYPKLARSEFVGDKSAPINHVISWMDDGK
jgi:hypothetical protein